MRLAFLASLPLLSLSAPCDVFASGGTPCVAAHSVVRALYSSYAGPLYQVNRSDGELLDIGVKSPGGYADAAAQDAFCAPSLSNSSLPPLNATVLLSPVQQADFSFRHCDAQGFITETDDSLDHEFKLVPALNGDAAARSFQSVNFALYYIAPVATAEPGRLGVVQAPAADAASWTVAPAVGGGFTLSLPGGRGAAAVGANLTGSCAPNYAPPAAGVFLTAAGGTPWLIAPRAPPPCTISKIYDQSPRGNDLGVAPAGGAAPSADMPVDATRLKISAGGNPVYAAYFQGGQGCERSGR